MSEVETVALITGLSSLLAAGVGATVTYLVSRNSSAAAIATAGQQAETEQAKLKAELERLREQHREAERQNRQGTYHRYLAVLDRLDTFGTGFPPTDAQFDDAIHEFNFLHGGILLFGDEPVKAALSPVTDGFHKVGALMDPAHRGESFARAYREHREEIVSATGRLVAVMSGDVQRGILPE